MKLTRGKRIALELLGPPAIGGTLATWFLLGWDWLPLIGGDLSVPKRDIEVEVILKLWFGFVIGAYLFAGIQSIIYALILECKIAKGLDPRSWQMVRLSTLLGFVAGVVLIAASGPDELLQLPYWGYFGGIGLTVGFLMGLLIRYGSAEKTPVGKSTP